MQKARLSLLAGQARLLACTSLCTHPHILQRHSGAFSTVTAPLLLHVGAHRNSSGFWSIQSSSQWWSHTPSSRLSTNSRPQGPTDSASSSSSADRKPQVPPAVAAGAAAAGDAASKAAKAAAKQASRLVKLVQSTSLSEATRLQLSSTWQSHSAAITAASAAAATAGVYQLAAAVAGHFVDMSDPIAFWSCLSASAAAVAVAGMQIHASFTVDPQRVYRITMRKLNRHAGLQEVMGSPFAGSDVRLELVSQGSLFVQETLLPKRRAPRLHLMFQLTGPTKTGVVSVEAKKAFGSKYSFKTLMVELPDKTLTSKAAAAAGVAAFAKAEAARAAAPGSSLASSSATTSSSSSNSSGDSRDGGSSAGSGSTGESSSAAPGSSASAEPARIYVIGSPAGSGSSSSTRHMSPSTLLQDLKDPLLFALKHNLVGYEAEDESEGQLAWSKPQDDPDQTTWWDDTKRASKLLACRTYTGARKAGAAALEAASKAGARLRAQAAASAAAAASTSSSSAGGGGSGTAGAAAPAASKPATAPSSGTGSTSTPANSGGSSSSSSTGSADSSADAAPVPPSSSNKEAAPWSQ